jgi:hypothetical protein
LIISLHDLQDVVNKTCKHICDEYHKAVSMCIRGKDLPGIGPKFYLHSDLTWNVGYEPTAEVIASVDAKDFSTADLASALEGELTYNHHEIGRETPTTTHGTANGHEPASEVAHSSAPSGGTERHGRTGKARMRVLAAPNKPKRKKREKAAW